MRILLSFTLGGLLFGACTRSETARPTYIGAPVVLISIDTLRADRLPIYGYKSVETPNIDRLAADAVVFDRAWSPCPMTLPSHVSMLTGLLPTTHGVRNNIGFRYDAQKFPSLPQILARRGYATGAAVSSYVIRGETGLRDAFHWYDDAVDPQPGAPFSEFQRNGRTTTSILEKWISSLGRQPFFAFLHLYEPHVPYSPPEPFRSRFGNAYDGEIATADAIVGDFLDELKARGLYDDAIVIVTSDHGEGLGDHGEMQHSILLYTEMIRVPLLIKLPRSARAGTRVSGDAALVDLVPTIESLMGLDPTKTDGVDLLAGSLPDRDIYSETIYPYVQLGWSDLRSLIRGDLHYIDSPRPELYDLQNDPKERIDIIVRHRREAARFRGILAGFPPPTAGNTAIDPEDAAKLAALGYVGSVRPRPDPRSLPNPRDHIGVVDEIRVAFRLANERKYEDAVRVMRAILSKNQRLVDVWIRLADVLDAMGRDDEAINAYKQAIAAAGPDLSSDILVGLGFLYLQTGRVEDAERAAELSLRGSPDKARELQVRVALKRRDLDTAERIARTLVDRPNASASDVLLLAEVRHARGDETGALDLIDQALARAAASGANSLYGLEALRAEVLVGLNRIDDAIAAYEKEVAQFPANRIAWSRLAILYFLAGDRRAVERTLERLVAANPTTAAYNLAASTLDALEDSRGARRWREKAARIQ